ncbi:MAG: hypothetical protein ACI4HQ_03255 [Acetatifactor sp.]
MKIDSSTIGMESERSYRTSNTTVRRFSIKDYQGGLTQDNNALNTAIDSNPEDPGNAGKQEGAGEKGEGTEKSVNTLQDWQMRFQKITNPVSVRNSASQTLTNIREQTIRYIFEMLFAARRGRLNRWMEDNAYTSGGVSAETKMQGEATLSPMVMNTKVLSYEQVTCFEETEQTQFSTVGTVRTTDGRELRFNVNVAMSRTFQQTYREDLELASFSMCDPLVINLDTDVAELKDQTFYFDIDADGEPDEISQLGSGSGYLALDNNGDGRINDGSELFGTASGNGFADLAEYDEDGNGWIDENDSVWQKLKIWVKDADGNDVLYRLADKGVGAICLQNAGTEFTQKGSAGQTMGAIRRTGIFLYENGNVGTLQHLDVARYYKNYKEA